MIEKLYTVEEVAELASVTGRTIRNYLKSGRLVGRKIGGQWRFPESEVQRLLTGAEPESVSAEPALPPNPMVNTENRNQSAPVFVLPANELQPEPEPSPIDIRGTSGKSPFASGFHKPVEEPYWGNSQPVEFGLQENVYYAAKPAPLPINHTPPTRQAPHQENQPNVSYSSHHISQPQEPSLPQHTLYRTPQPLNDLPEDIASPYSAPLQQEGPMYHFPPVQKQATYTTPEIPYSPPQNTELGYYDEPPARYPQKQDSYSQSFGQQPVPSSHPSTSYTEPSLSSQEHLSSSAAYYAPPQQNPPEESLLSPSENIAEGNENEKTETSASAPTMPELSDVGKQVMRFVAEVHDCSHGPQICSIIDLHQTLPAAKTSSERLSEIARQESENGILCKSFVEFDERYFVARYTLFGSSAFLARCLKLLG